MFSMNESTDRYAERPRKTPFIHVMRGTPEGIVCPPYHVLSHGNGCPYACDYCCLQLPLADVERPVIFSQRDRLLDEVRRFLSRGEGRLLSAGESSDGLAFDNVTRLSEDLGELFARQDEGMLFPRLRPNKLLWVTKSANVERLLASHYRANTIASFSLNAPEVAARYEHGAPHPWARLDAARRCQEAGFEVRLRIDPIIPEQGWERWYARLLRRITVEMATDGLRVTLGTIRHNAGLRQCARERGRAAGVFGMATSREGADRRYRLPVPLRRRVYRWMIARLPEATDVGLCKETGEIWDGLGLDVTDPKCNCML